MPQSDDDFRKPPAELRAAFAGVREIPGQPGLNSPKFSDLEAQWGASQSKQLDLQTYLGGRTPTSILALSIIGPVWTAVGVAAIPWVIIPPNEYVHTYEKGDYRVRVHTMSAFGTDEVTINWDWMHHSVSGDAELFAADDAPPRLRFISRFGAMFGSGWARNKFDSNHPKLEEGIEIAYGTEISVIPTDVLNLAFLLGYRASNAVNENTGYGLSIREYPVQATVEHRILPDVKIGAGVAKHTNALLTRSDSNNVSLGEPIGVVFTGEYKRFGIKAEHLNYKINNGPSINGDSITLTINFN